MDEIATREPPPTADTTARPASPWPWVILAIVLTPLLALIIAVVVTLGGVAHAWQTVNQLMTGRLVVKTDQPAVVLQVQQLNRLETASFTVEKVIEGGQDRGNALLNALLGDRLLFIAHGEVIAGVDLSRLQPADITVSQDGQAVSVRLPPASVLNYRLDNDKSRVYDRQQGLLAPSDPNLETQVRQEAEQQILQAACEEGILAQAQANAESQVRALLLNMHFTQVTFQPTRGAGSGC